MIVFSFPCFLKGNTIMPNRTIYVAGADLSIFEKAQKLAGDNLSAAIPEVLYESIVRYNNGEDVEILDI